MKVKNTASIKNLEKLYKSEKGADVEFVLQSKLFDGEAKVPAHKAILAASSPVFDSMFYGDLKEGAVVEITDVSFEAFCEFLQFFYVDEMELTEANIREVFEMVDKYDVQESTSVCERFLKSTVTTELVCPYLEIGLTYNYPKELIENFEETITTQAVDIFKTISFKESNQMVLKKILEMDVLDCAETDVFAAAMSWATERCDSKSLPASSENIKSELGECLSLIRFPTMTVEEFADCMEKYVEFLDYNVLLDIMRYIAIQRPLTFAIEFNHNPRFRSSIDISFWNENVTIGKRRPDEETFRSIVSFTVEAAVYLNYCDIVIAGCGKRMSCTIRLNEQQINYFSSLGALVIETTSQEYNVYRLNFEKPQLCVKNVEYEFDFYFNCSLEQYMVLIEANQIPARGIQFAPNKKNYSVKSLNFQRKV